MNGGQSSGHSVALGAWSSAAGTSRNLARSTELCENRQGAVGSNVTTNPGVLAWSDQPSAGVLRLTPFRPECVLVSALGHNITQEWRTHTNKIVEADVLSV